ncbi:MAG TPA: MFS transporter [Gammaproteobacteria bacterium]|nr:MFS transporter [Gammaproteobacteria bacterium]
MQGAVELLGAVGLAAALAVLFLLSLTAALVLLPVVGVFPTGTSSVLHAIVADLVAPEARARWYGLFYMLYQGLGIVAPVLYGWFSDATELTWAMILLGILTMAAAPLAVLLREQTAIVTA